MSKLTKNRKLVLSKIEPNKVYKLGEAAALLKEITFTKFDASVDLDVRLGVDPRKSNQMVRGVVTLREQADTEKLFLENPQDAFLIYQIRRGGELDAYRFMNYDYLQSKGVTPERDGYDAIYTGGLWIMGMPEPIWI